MSTLLLLAGQLLLEQSQAGKGARCCQESQQQMAAAARSAAEFDRAVPRSAAITHQPFDAEMQSRVVGISDKVSLQRWLGLARLLPRALWQSPAGQRPAGHSGWNLQQKPFQSLINSASMGCLLATYKDMTVAQVAAVTHCRAAGLMCHSRHLTHCACAGGAREVDHLLPARLDRDA